MLHIVPQGQRCSSLDGLFNILLSLLLILLYFFWARGVEKLAGNNSLDRPCGDHNPEQEYANRRYL